MIVMMNLTLKISSFWKLAACLKKLRILNSRLKKFSIVIYNIYFIHLFFNHLPDYIPY